MEEFKGTNGEWYIENKKIINEFGAFGIDISSFYQRQFITIWGINDKDKESEANAKLIAAAPELLESVENLLGLIDNPIIRRIAKKFPNYLESVESAKQAIQKALK